MTRMDASRWRVVLLCCVAILSSIVVHGHEEVPVEYGADVSFPSQHKNVTTNYPWLEHNTDHSSTVQVPKEYEGMVLQPLGERQTFYDNYIQGCIDHFGPKKAARCRQNEADRVAMTLRQPMSMQNYTKLGFKKIKTPKKVWDLIQSFWEKNKKFPKPENWGIGNTYTNNWETHSKMVSVEDTGLRGGGGALKQEIWDAAKDTLQEWTGEELTQCSLYGVRVYYEGSVLAPHVDRLPLVSSAIINVDQDVDEPWPLEVIGHDGKAHNVTMEPGDMVLYESHSVIHGRPFSLKGRYFANLFIHFEPVGHTLRHHDHETDAGTDVDKKYRDASSRGSGGHETTQDGLPSYILKGTPEETRWRQTHSNGIKSKKKSSVTGSTVAHLAAQDGNIKKLKAEVEKKKDLIHKADSNGWQPIHEGARGGHTEIVRYLVENGADINAKTGQAGGTALYYAKQKYEADHPIVALLESLGGVEIGPDL